MNISNAFSNGRLERAPFMLNKAPQVWNQTREAYLKGYGLGPLTSEPYFVFLRNSGGTNFLVLILHVYDIFYAPVLRQFQSSKKAKREKSTQNLRYKLLILLEYNYSKK